MSVHKYEKNELLLLICNPTKLKKDTLNEHLCQRNYKKAYYIYFDFVMIRTQMIQGEIRQIKNYIP